MGVIDRWRSFVGAPPLQRGSELHELRDINPLSFGDFLSYFVYGGVKQALTGGTLVGDTERVGSGFNALVEQVYKSNGIVFACMMVRQMLFSEARFQWREIRNGRPGKLFGNSELFPLENPWPGGTTGDLLSRMINDADLAGNSYIRRQGNALVRLRPDWVTIAYDDYPWLLTANVVAYGYQPGGPAGGRDIELIDATEVAHFAPLPDPTSPHRGMSWLLPIIREIESDIAATSHKEALFTNGATPNMVVSFDPSVSKEIFDAYVESIKTQHEGPENAYKTLFLGAGAHADVVGSSLRQLDFKNVQGAGETRIAAAAGVPPVIAGFSEGLAAATYSNYSQARRRFADGTLRPLWRNAAGSLEWIVNTPSSRAGRNELWYDDRDIPFLREDEKDTAEILATQAGAIKNLVDSGFQPDTAVAAVSSGDLDQLDHTGLYSVQLLPAGEQPGEPSSNGNKPPKPAPALPAGGG